VDVDAWTLDVTADESSLIRVRPSPSAAAGAGGDGLAVPARVTVNVRTPHYRRLLPINSSHVQSQGSARVAASETSRA